LKQHGSLVRAGNVIQRLLVHPKELWWPFGMVVLWCNDSRLYVGFLVEKKRERKM
jgi:hypothetical protein